MVWCYEDFVYYYDVQWLWNGNLLYVVCELVDVVFVWCVLGGIVYGDDEVMFVDVIWEVNCVGQIVWEWYVCDYLWLEDFLIVVGFGCYYWLFVNGFVVDVDGCVLMSLCMMLGIIGVNCVIGCVDLYIGFDVVLYQYVLVLFLNGNIFVFDNGNFCYGVYVVFLCVVEIDLVMWCVVWLYVDDVVNLFYMLFMGNVQCLLNGNMYVIELFMGWLFEVMLVGEVVWEYVILWFVEYLDEVVCKIGFGQLNSVFQMFCYSVVQLFWLWI